MCRAPFSLMAFRIFTLLVLGVLPSLGHPLLAQSVPSRGTNTNRQLPTRQELADSYQKSCVGSETGNRRKVAYCKCAFDALYNRYSKAQMLSMNQLMVSGGPAVRRFSSLAFEPEYSTCRTSSGYTPSRSSSQR